MNRTLFDRPAGAELTGNDLKRPLATGDDTRIRRRLTMLGLAFAAGFTMLSMRVVMLAAPSTDSALAAFAGESADEDTVTPSEIAPELPVNWRQRAAITDRDGRLLAVDLPTQALTIHTRKVRDPARLSMQLALALGDTTPEEIRERIERARNALWLRWRLTPDQVAAVLAVGNPALELVPNVTRGYPTGRLTAHVVGFLDSERQGRTGLEKGIEDRLLDIDAGPVRTSLHLGVQHIVRQELAASIEKFSAIGGAGLVMDIHTGEVLAMVSLPDFDANLRDAMRADAFFNRATFGRYEMGSTFKTFTAAMALELNRHRLTDIFDATDPIRFGRFTIRDHHAQARPMTIAEIFEHSSNIGAAKMAMDVGTAGQQRFLRAIGLLDPAPIEIPEVIAPQQPARWRDLETMTISYGHGLAVSPLQLATAVGAMVNGGNYIAPTLLRRSDDNPVTLRPVMSEKTSRDIRKLFRLVVSDGTGKAAAAPGFVVGGKTGTAEKAIVRGYSRKRMVTSFVGAFPMQAPRYVVLAMLDEPQGIKETYNFATAGWNAAPTVGRIIPRIAPLLGVPAVNEDDPAVRAILALPPGARPEEERNATL